MLWAPVSSTAWLTPEAEQTEAPATPPCSHKQTIQLGWDQACGLHVRSGMRLPRCSALWLLVPAAGVHLLHAAVQTFAAQNMPSSL